MLFIFLGVLEEVVEITLSRKIMNPKLATHPGYCLRSDYSVQCIVYRGIAYSVECTGVLCTVYSVHECCVQCTVYRIVVYSVQEYCVMCTGVLSTVYRSVVYSVQECCIQCKVYRSLVYSVQEYCVQYTMNSVQSTVYSTKSNL